MPDESHPSGSDRSPGSIWSDLKSPRLIWIKGLLFCVLGVLAAAVLLVRRLDWVDAALLLITVWSFCRAYYFAFYVIEHYVDPGYRFDGLGSFLRYALKAARQDSSVNAEQKK